MFTLLDRRHRNWRNPILGSNIKWTFNFMIFFGSDKWISLRTSGFVNPLVRRTSRFFDEIRALTIYVCFYVSIHVRSNVELRNYVISRQIAIESRVT